MDKMMTISHTASVLDAMKKIEKNKNRAVFVINTKEKEIVGVLTDGDVRRYIIAQGKDFDIHTPIRALIQNKSFVAIDEYSCDFATLANVFQDGKVEILPIINHHGHIINFITKEHFHTIMLENKTLTPHFPFSKLEKNKIEKEIVSRPWGFYKSIALTRFTQAKLINLFPNQQISLQKHKKREEHWIVVYGKGRVILEDSHFEVYPGKYIFVPKGCKHRISNTSKTHNLIFCEVQLGTYFGEDDIIRYQDSYNRSK